MLEQLDSIDWDRLPQPAENAPGAVPRRIREIAAVVPEEDWGYRSYHNLLWAVGNNSAGQYFPVVVQVVPFLGEIIREGTPAAREVALDLLVDLTTSFVPEAGYETIVVPGQGERPLRDVLREALAALRDDLQRCADAGQSGPSSAGLALWVLHALDHPECGDYPDCDHPD